MVHRDDLKDYAHAELSLQENGSGEERIRVSSVVELLEKEPDEASRISNSLVAMLNCKDPSWGPVRYNMINEPEFRKARLVLYGSPPFI